MQTENQVIVQQLEHDFLNRPLAEVKEQIRQVLESLELKMRIVGPQYISTQDIRFDRINLWVNDGLVQRIYMG